MTTDEIISRCYEHGQPDYIMAAERLKELQAQLTAPSKSTLLSSLPDEEAANLAAHIWAAGADCKTANFVGSQLAKKNVRLVPDRATEEMWQAGKRADEHHGDSYSKVYFAMIEAAPKA